MTRPLLKIALLCAAGVMATSVPTAPVRVDGAAVVPFRARHTPSGNGIFAVGIGDGLVRVMIRGCATCRTLVTIEIRLPKLTA